MSLLYSATKFFNEYHPSTHRFCGVMKILLLVYYKRFILSNIARMLITIVCQSKYYFTYKQFYVVSKLMVLQGAFMDLLLPAI